jgi:hypothetical protein
LLQCEHQPPHPPLRGTFSPREKEVMAQHLICPQRWREESRASRIDVDARAHGRRQVRGVGLAPARASERYPVPSIRRSNPAHFIAQRPICGLEPSHQSAAPRIKSGAGSSHQGEKNVMRSPRRSFAASRWRPRPGFLRATECNMPIPGRHRFINSRSLQPW